MNGGCCSAPSVPPIPIPLCPSGIKISTFCIILIFLGVLALVPCAPTCTAPTAPNCCPVNSQCVPGIGCCPQPVSAPAPPPQLPICPTSNQLAIAVCSPQSQCPSGTECNRQLQACCPLKLCPSGKFFTYLEFNFNLGAQALQTCANGCPPQTVRFKLQN